MAWYPWLRMLHVALAAAWVLGLLTIAAACFPAAEPSAPSRFLQGLARWNVRVIWPVMLLALVCGSELARMAGWFGQPWLDAKLALVALLVLLQIALSAVLRRLIHVPDYRSPGWVLSASMVVFILGLGVLILAAVKPYW
ncbi:membrane protein [Bordetella ansorpii]|uniref:Protoporphyrinogen IX oxidase n=1 Tax=Bordetella ansorpii TaxID=288768 RepID=A0A157QSH0_9BORD|nr:CopD family protein [Bordetella ansorpii]SAI48731.1 membrane protein [Bordetella ansorpii]